MDLLYVDEPTLLTEYNHRLCNTFQILSTQISRCERVSGCDVVRPMLGDLSLRLRALAAMHRLLAAPHPQVPFEDHCRQLCAYLVQAFDREDVARWVRMDDLPLMPDCAAKVSLIVVELVTNTLKHSFQNEHGGTIWIDLRATPEGAEIVVRNSRTTPVKTFASSKIVVDLARTLAGQAFVVDHDGYTAGVRFPL